MDRKIKLAAAISLVGLSAAACAPNPYWQYPGANYNATNRSTAGSSKASVTHSHNGKVHSHPLPAQGLSHTHNTGQAAPQTNTNYNYTQPQTNSYYTNTYPYDSYAYNNQYSGTSGGTYYDYSTPKTTTTTTSSGSYYDYMYTTPTTTTTTTSTNTYSGGDTYVVQKGDTVFQVMRNTGVYWKDVIRLNNLQAPDYTIKPGQSLRLK